MNALIFSIECREIFSMCFPEDLHFYMKKAHPLSKMRIVLMHFFGLNFIEALKMAENFEKTKFYVFCLFTFLSAFQALSCLATDRSR